MFPAGLNHRDGTTKCGQVSDLLADDTGGNGYYVYRDAWGFLALNNLIDTSDPDAALLLSFGPVRAIKMNNRLPGPGFGELVGITPQPFLLTPVSVP